MKGSVDILGVPFSKLTFNETIHQLSEQIQKETQQSDEQLKKIIQEADLITPDGIGIVMGAKSGGEPISERVTGYDLLLRLLECGNERGWSFYFLGTDEETNHKAVEEVQRKYPNVRVAGRHHGFFSPSEELHILENIKRSQPDLLIIAMGASYTDKWIYQHKTELSGVKIAFGVGGSLDVIAGKVKPTPSLWKSMNLEWLHRLLTVPVAKGQKSRWRRQSALPVFFYKAIIRK